MITKSTGYTIFQIINYIILTLVTFLFLFPYVHMLAIALTPGDSAGVFLIPNGFTFANFGTIFQDPTLINSAFITVSRVITGTLLAFIVQFLAAYAFTRKSMPGRSKLLLFLTLPMFLSAGLVPSFILMAILGLNNTFWVYILPTCFSMYNMIIMRTYIEGLPQSLTESARVDGASELRVLWSIVLPLSKPIIATICLWLAVGHWNDWVQTLYYASSNVDLHTLQYRMYLSLNEANRIQELIKAAQESASGGADLEALQAQLSQLKAGTLVAAQLIVTTLPIICVYPFVQKYFVKGVMIGSVKG